MGTRDYWPGPICLIWVKMYLYSKLEYKCQLKQQLELTVARSWLGRVRAAGTACTCSFHNTSSHAPCPTPPKLHCNSVYIYSFSGNCAASAPISTFMCLWAIYIFPGLVHIFPPAEKAEPSWEYIICSQTHECGNWNWDPWYSFSGNICSKFLAFCLCSVSKTIMTGLLAYDLCKLLNFLTKSSVYV